MAKGTLEIRRKLKSIKSTRQITKAMELVAASKMKKAVSGTLALRPYANLARALLENLSDKVKPEIHPLLAKRETKNILVILVSTDKGLCGGLNTQLFRSLNEYLKKEAQQENPPDFSFIAVGKKGSDFLRRTGRKIIATYGTSVHPTLKETYPISRMVLQDYQNAAYDKVMLVYTDFISAVSQKPRVRRLLPLSKFALEEMIEGIANAPHTQHPKEGGQSPLEYLFEPNPNRVLEILLPRLTEMQIYQSLLEAQASEHSARMFAMRNATDNATEIIDDLTLTYNGVRQASITAELAEISAGRAALG